VSVHEHMSCRAFTEVGGLQAQVRACACAHAMHCTDHSAVLEVGRIHRTERRGQGELRVL